MIDWDFRAEEYNNERLDQLAKECIDDRSELVKAFDDMVAGGLSQSFMEDMATFVSSNGVDGLSAMFRMRNEVKRYVREKWVTSNYNYIDADGLKYMVDCERADIARKERLENMA